MPASGMTTVRRPRARQRGNSLLLALIVMSALATLGALTVVSVQSSLKTSTNDRSETIARYAAESGAAVAMDFLRGQTADWTTYVRPSNNPSVTLSAPDLPSSGALPGMPDNLFSADQNAWFSVEILNNRNDPGFATGSDMDRQLIIRSTGHGPQGSVAIVEWEVRSQAANTPLILMGWRVVL